jgi:hypothetical protein
MALNFEGVIRSSRSKEAQIDQQVLTSVLKLVVTPRGDEVTGGDRRDDLKSSTLINGSSPFPSDWH